LKDQECTYILEESSSIGYVPVMVTAVIRNTLGAGVQLLQSTYWSQTQIN
jgi:hypothetical protein